MSHAWWRGSRGEGFVVAQLALFALIAFGPRTLEWIPAWPWPQVWRIAGTCLMSIGGLIVLAGGVSLGRSLTPLPYPREGGHLVETGPYAVVRHPIYSGGLLLALGWALWTRGALTLGHALLLFALLDAKSRREERWLAARFSGYVRYKRRVRKLIPFVY